MSTDQCILRRKALQNKIIDGVAILFNAKEVARNSDCHFKFRPDSYFHYFSYFPEPEAVIFILAGDKPRSIIFCRPKNPELETWEGFRFGPDEAKEQYGFDEAYSIEKINEIAPKIIAQFKSVYTPADADQNSQSQIQSWININKKQKRAGVRTPEMMVNLSHIADAMRVVKSESELDVMQKSANIAAKAHTIAMQKTKPGLYEYQIEGEILNQFMQLGAKEPSYQSIVAGGINACTLHYSANNSKLVDGDLLLIDAGCELELYASDITRTYPINGRFSSAQKTIYELVLASQKASILEVKPGNSFNKPHETALNILIQGMVDLGLCKGSVDEVLEKKLYRDFFMHRTSHWLGLDVHDVGNYVDNNENSVLLEKGNVLTIEPGCYIKPSETTPKEFWGIGIRIEDDVEVTNQGNKVLSIEAPKEINEIESLVGSFF